MYPATVSLPFNTGAGNLVIEALTSTIQAWAVGLGNTHGCVPDDNMAGNGLLNQGTLDTPEGPFPGVLDPSHPNKDDGTAKLRANCQRATADEVLQFIAFGFGLALLLIGFLQMRRGKSYGAGGYVA